MKKAILIIIISLIIITVIIGFTQAIHVQSSMCEQKTINNLIANQQFLDEIGYIDNLNNGITIEIRKIPFSSGKDKLYPTYIFNYTEESITFRNEAYGMTIFSFNENTNKWNKVEISMVYENTPIKIRPNNTKKGHENSSVIVKSSLKNVDFSEPIRIFVSGIGDVSHLRYGAYTDIVICDE